MELRPSEQKMGKSSSNQERSSIDDQESCSEDGQEKL